MRGRYEDLLQGSCVILAARLTHVAYEPARTCPAYEFVSVRSRRALVTACPYPSLLK